MKILNLSRVLMLCALCATVLFSSCEKDDDSNSYTRDNFVAVYSAIEDCAGNPDNYDVTILAGPSDDALIINNLYGADVSDVTATVDGDNLTIDNQNFEIDGGATSTIEGSGSLDGEVLTITFTTGVPGFLDTCTSICTKK